MNSGSEQWPGRTHRQRCITTSWTPRPRLARFNHHVIRRRDCQDEFRQRFFCPSSAGNGEVSAWGCERNSRGQHSKEPWRVGSVIPPLQDSTRRFLQLLLMSKSIQAKDGGVNSVETGSQRKSCGERERERERDSEGVELPELRRD